jgi:hypothetical protein
VGWVHRPDARISRCFSVGPGNSSNVTFPHNTTGGLPSPTNSGNPYGTSGSVYFDGKVGQTLPNVTIEYNSFGDTNSCTAVFNQVVDNGGSCARALIHQGVTTNITIKYNKFFHLEEGMHVFNCWKLRSQRGPVCIGRPGCGIQLLPEHSPD